MNVKKIVNWWADLPAPVPIGQMFSENWASLSNWTQSGAATWSVSGNVLTVSGGSGVFTDFITYDPLPNSCEDWTCTMDFKITVAGFGIGITAQELLTTDGTNRSFSGRFVGSGASAGKILIDACNETTTTFVNKAISSTAITWAVGDNMRLVLQKAWNVYTLTVFNLTTTANTLAPITYTVPSDQSGNPTAANPAFKFSIKTFGGTQTVSSISATTTNRKNIWSLWVGDSRTYGISASSKSQRYQNVLYASSGRAYETNSGGSDRTGQYTVQGTWINTYKAKYVIIALGRNDVAFGVAEATIEANIATIYNNVKAGGGTPLILLFPSDTGATMTTFNNAMKSTYPAGNIIDLSGKTYSYAADGVHFSNTGMASIAADIKLLKPFLL